MSGKNSESALICGGSMPGSSVAAARSLGRKGVEVYGLAFNHDHPLLHSAYCNYGRVVTSPREDYQLFKEELLSIVREENIDTVIPLNEYEMFALKQNEALFAEHLSNATPDVDTYEAAWDRTETINAALECDIPVPETKLLENWKPRPEPLIAKSRYSILQGRNKLRYPDIEQISPSTDLDLEALVNRMGHSPLIQEYIPSDGEFGFFTIFDNGSPLVKFQHRRVRSIHHSGGASVHRTAVAIPELELMGTRLLEHLEWHGPAMVEFRRDARTGEYKLMEINPRFWGSLPLGIHAGIDFPWIYYQLSQGYSETGVSKYDTTTTATYLRGEIQHLLSTCLNRTGSVSNPPSIANTLWNQITSVPGSKYDLFDWEDPGPFIWDIVRSARKGFK